MATLYCSPSGGGSGTSFSDLATFSAASKARSNVLVCIKGDYGNWNFATAASGTTTVTVRAVDPSLDSGVTGYSTSLWDAPAVFNVVTIEDPYLVMNGVRRTETHIMEEPLGYGMRVTGDIRASSIDGHDAHGSQFSYINGGGTWNATGTPDCDGLQQAIYLVFNQHDITFTKCCFHNAGVNNGAIAMLHGSENIVFDECDIYMGWGKATFASPNAVPATWTTKNCRFWNSSRLDTCPAAEGPGITCEIGSYSVDEDHSGHLIYGCVIYNTASGGRNGVIMFGEPLRDGEAQGCKVFNNTFVGIPESSVLAEIYLKGGANNEARNNLFYGTASSDITANATSNNVTATGNPFIAGGYPTTLDFRIDPEGEAANAGTDVGAPYNVDRAGTTRGTSGNWSAGAYEVDGEGEPEPEGAVANITTANITNLILGGA
jgi:hypothetical protein